MRNVHCFQILYIFFYSQYIQCWFSGSNDAVMTYFTCQVLTLTSCSHVRLQFQERPRNYAESLMKLNTCKILPTADFLVLRSKERLLWFLHYKFNFCFGAVIYKTPCCRHDGGVRELCCFFFFFHILSRISLKVQEVFLSRTLITSKRPFRTSLMADKKYSLFLLCISEREMNTFDIIHSLCVVVYGGFVF